MIKALYNIWLRRKNVSWQRRHLYQLLERVVNLSKASPVPWWVNKQLTWAVGDQWQTYGICHMFGGPSDEVYKEGTYHIDKALIEKMFLGWPPHSGDRYYPVDDKRLMERGYTQFMNAVCSKTMWRGDYGRLRHSLLDHTLIKLETAAIGLH